VLPWQAHGGEFANFIDVLRRIASGPGRIKMDHKLLYLSKARIKGSNLAQGMYCIPELLPCVFK